MAARFPALVPALLHRGRSEALVDHCGSVLRAFITDAATASRTIRRTLTASSARTASSALPSAVSSARVRFSLTTRSSSGPRRASTARSTSSAIFSSVARSMPVRRRASSSATTSVSTGTSPAPRGGFASLSNASTRPLSGLLSRSSASLMRARQVMIGDLVAAVDVEAVALAASRAPGFVGGHNLEQPLEAREVRRAHCRKIEQQRALRGHFFARGDEHRRLGRELVARRAVRQEPYRLPGPQHLVDGAGGAAVGC